MLCRLRSEVSLGYDNENCQHHDQLYLQLIAKIKIKSVLDSAVIKIHLPTT